MSQTLSFIVVNWNGGELLKRCFESIARHPPSTQWDIIAVDNASTDGSREWLHQRADATRLTTNPVHLIENATNAGFGAANNQAFEISRAHFLFLLNADAELTAGSCDTLIKTLSSDARIGACGPRLLNPDGSLQISVWRNPPTAWATLLSGLRLASLLPPRLRGELLLAEHWKHDRRRDVGMLGGAALLVRREVIEEVGGFDERFHMYGEDNEWCLRITRAGWRLVFEPEAVVIHQGGHSSLQRWTDVEKVQLQTKAYLEFLNRAVPRHKVVTNLLASTGLLTIQRMLRRIRNRPANEVDSVLKLHFQDLRRVLTGRTNSREN